MAEYVMRTKSSGLAELDRVVVDPDTPQEVVSDLRRRSVPVEVAEAPRQELSRDCQLWSG